MFKIRKYFLSPSLPILIIALQMNIVSASSSSKKDLPVKKSEANDCALIADFDELVNHRWPDLMDSNISGSSPRMNIQENADSYHIEAELPGVKKEDVEITLKDDNLIIHGEKKSFNEEIKNQYRRIERTNGTFYRSVALPRDFDKDKITSELKDGILKVDIMKLKNSRPSQEKRIKLL